MRENLSSIEKPCLRVRVSIAVIALIIASLLGGCTSNVSSNKPSAIIYTAKQILTMNAEQPTATAVAIADGKILAVGNQSSIEKSLGAYDLTLDSRFQEQVLMPGFIENHLHPTLAGILLPSVFITPWSWTLPSQAVEGVQNQQDYLAALSDALRSHHSDQPFITWGYHQYFHGQLTREDLDTLSNNVPIIVWHRSFHEVVLNSAAINVLGIDTQKLANHPAIDLAKGHFWELGLFAIFPNLQPVILNPERYQQGVLEGFRHAMKNGITTVADQGFPLFDFSMELNQLDAVIQQNQIPTSVYIVGNGKTLAMDGLQQGITRLAALPASNRGRIQFLPKQVKLLADGAFYSQLMQMEDGYLDGHHGEWITPPEELEAAARAYWKAGYQLHIHVNGDLGLNVVLDIIETLTDEMPRDHNTVLHHYGFSGEQHAERLAALGVSVSANPYYLWALADKYAEIGLGPERAKFISRLGDLERNGVPISLHSDLPMAPANPLRLASIAANRKTANGNLLAPEERLTIDGALRSITLEAARAIQQAQRIGSIEIGKQADFTILGDDPTALNPASWPDISIDGIIKDGVIHTSLQLQ